MASNDEVRSAPPWLWPNLLSLDAPVIAVIWQGFLSYRFSVPLRPAARAALGLTVWAIYLADRLLDARKGAIRDEPARHRFYRRHSRLMTALFAMVFAAAAIVAILGLRPVVLRDGLIPLAGVGVYLGLVHLSGTLSRIPKEVAASFLFTAGTFLAAWARLPCPSLAWAALAFFVLCLANMIAIEAWEWREGSNGWPPHASTRWLAKTYLWWVPAVVFLCVIAGRNPWYLSIAASASACAALFWLGRRLPLEARRALVDGALLSPLLFLMIR
jgi:hypothetical protein